MKIGNLEVYGIIYKITNLVNGKVYIGQAINGFDRRYSFEGKDIERVYNSHKSHKTHKSFYNKHLVRSIEKYGFDNFSVSKIFDVAFSKEELNIKEQLWIGIYDSFNNGYNQTFGGSNGNTFVNKTQEEMEDIKRKISKSNKGRFIGKNGYWYGKHHTDEIKFKVLQTKIDNNNTRKIYQLDKNTYKIIKQYDSISLATKELKLSRSAIKNVLNSNYNSITAGGYAWKYIDEENIKYTDKYKDDILKNKLNRNHKKRDEILELYDKGSSFNEIEKSGYKNSTIRDTLQKHRDYKVKEMLSKEEILIRNNKIIELYLKGFKNCEIERELGLSRRVVQKTISKHKNKLKGDDINE